jgi:hypothetical protein
MFTLRCTRKLLKRLGATPSSEVVAPTTVLGDWTANLLYLRPQQLVLAMNERSLLCVVVPASPGSDLGPRLRHAVAELLLSIGVPAMRVADECVAMETMAIGATASRAVLGCMNDAVVQLGAYPLGRGVDEPTLGDAALHLAGNIYSVTDYQRPWVRALELFGVPGRPVPIVRSGTVH